MDQQHKLAYQKFIRETQNKRLNDFTKAENQVHDFLGQGDRVHFFKNLEWDTKIEVIENIRNGGLERISTGYSGHSSQFVFYKGYLAICNSRYNDERLINVYKINPEKVTLGSLMAIANLLRMEEKDSHEQIDLILKSLDAQKDLLCEFFFWSDIQNKYQKSGNCTVKSGNVALRFFQIMQLLSEKKLLETLDPNKLIDFFAFPIYTSPDLNKCLEENRRLASFRKLEILSEIQKNGELKEEDKEWFCEGLRKRVFKWALDWQKNRSPYPAETKRIFNLLDFAEKTFGFDLTHQDLSELDKYPIARQKLHSLIKQRQHIPN